MFMAVRDQLLVYQMGYSEAVSLVKAQLPVLCDVGVRMADDLLKKGSGNSHYNDATAFSTSAPYLTASA